MKLIYCTEDGYHLALRYGKEALDHDSGQDGPQRVRNAGRDVCPIEAGEVEFQALDGTVIEVEEEVEVTYFTLRDKMSENGYSTGTAAASNFWSGGV